MHSFYVADEYADAHLKNEKYVVTAARNIDSLNGPINNPFLFSFGAFVQHQEIRL